jgi:glycosyltransferase involved in cell wall biosynthesis
MIGMVRISVVTICKTDEEVEPLIKILKDQTFRDFEFIYSTKPSIPEAWNDAISKTKGDYIVFTETDVIPLDNNWLSEIVENIYSGCIIKGGEINISPLNMCNLVVDRTILEKFKFDERFKIAEDTEFFARISDKGYRIDQLNNFPVIHYQTKSWKKTIPRSWKYGILMAKIINSYSANTVINNNKLSSRIKNQEHPISVRIRTIFENVLFLTGLFVGMIYEKIVKMI